MNTTALDHLVEQLDIEDARGYFSSSGWKETKGESTIRFSKLENPDSFPVLELAASRKFADFNFRLRQVIEGLAIIESRPAMNVFVDMLGSPKAVVVRKLAANRLQLSREAGPDLNSLLEATSAAATFVASDDGLQFEKKYIDSVVSTCDFLADEDRLIGAIEDKQVGLLSVCCRLLAHAQICFFTPPSSAEFWKAAASNSSKALIKNAESLRLSRTPKTSKAIPESQAAADD